MTDREGKRITQREIILGMISHGNLWDFDAPVGRRSLEVYISELRREHRIRTTKLRVITERGWHNHVGYELVI